MAAAESVPNDATIPGAMPERWETAVEDIAQLVALGLDRAQDLADAIGELNHSKPGLAKVVAAAVGGALVGAFIASRRRPRPPTARERARLAASIMRRAASERASTIEQQAAAIAQAAAQRLAERAPSASDMRDRLPRVDRSDLGPRAAIARSRARRRFAKPDLGIGQVGSAAKLVPIAVELLRNPLVRALLWRAATRLTARR